MAEEKTKRGLKSVELKHDELITGLSFCRPDSTHVLISDESGLIVPWDCQTGKASSQKLEHEIPLSSIEVSADGKSFVGIAEIDPDQEHSCVERWCIATGKRVYRSAIYDAINQLVHSPDEKLLAFTDEYNTKVLDASTGKLIKSLGFEQGSSSVSFSPDSSKLAIGCRDGAVGVWDVKSGSKVWSTVIAGTYAWVSSMSFSSNGRLLVLAISSSVIGLDAADGSRVFENKEHTELVNSVASSPDGSTFASGGWDTTVRIFSSEDRSCLAVLPHPCTVLDVVYSPDSSRIAATCADGTARIWDLRQLFPSFADISRDLTKRKRPGDKIENFIESLKKVNQKD